MQQCFRSVWRYSVVKVAVLAVATVGAAASAFAQGTPRPPASVPYPSQGQQATTQQPSSHDLRCMQLEQELANDWVRGSQNRDELPKIDAEIRKYDRLYQSTRAKAERGGCYQSMFIFGRSLVRTPRCIRLHEAIEDARRKLASLQERRQAVSNPTSRSRRRDELVSALARAGCGSQYQQETRRRGGWFTRLFDEDAYTTPRYEGSRSRIESFATYRTLCVRTCDGYYFPISYSTLPSRFSDDVAQCQSQCAAPAELFVHRNPGEQAEQMISSDGSRAYSELPNAWRYRREYVKGCSCKTAEYDPAEIELANQKAEADKTPNEPTPGAPTGQVAQESQQLPKRQ